MGTIIVRSARVERRHGVAAHARLPQRAARAARLDLLESNSAAHDEKVSADSQAPIRSSKVAKREDN